MPGIKDIYRMTKPLGYYRGGPARAPELDEGFEPILEGYGEALANINNPEYARKWNMTRPRQPGLDEQLMQDYKPPIPRWGKAKELGKKGLEGIRSLFGAKEAGASTLGDDALKDLLGQLRIQLMLEKGIEGSVLMPSGNPDTIKRLEERISSLSNVEVYSSEIGELVMEELKKLDKVSFIRFASVYRDFKDVGEFQSQIEDLKE